MVPGIIILPPFNTKESSIDNSSLNAQNDLSSMGVSLALSGQPVNIFSLSDDIPFVFVWFFSQFLEFVCVELYKLNPDIQVYWIAVIHVR